MLKQQLQRWGGCILGLTLCLSGLHAADRPNVVLIVCDDLNDFEGVFGGHPQARTPNIDRLADTGVAFRRAYSNEPVCAPSRGSFLTGIYPWTSGNLFWKPWYENTVLANSKTLMEDFRDHGYHVVGSGKLFHHFRADDWDEFPHKADYGPIAYDGKARVGNPAVPMPYRSIGPIDGSFGSLSEVPFGGTNGAGWIYGAWGKTVQPFKYVSETDRSPTPDERNAQWAAERINTFAKQPDGKPFFLAVGFIRPHLPMYAPKKYFDLFPLDSVQPPVIKPGDDADAHYRDVYTMDQKGLRYFQLLKQSYPTTEAGLKAFTQAYLACVAAVDDCIGTVVNAVDRSPFKTNTIIIFTSDHGFNIGQKDYLFKNSPWEESTRVPLVIRAPGVAKAGGMAEHPVSLIDLYPTLVDLCDLKGDTQKNGNGKPLDGHSLRSFLVKPGSREWGGPDSAISMIYAGEDAKRNLSKAEQDELTNQQWSIRSERWRYILYNNGAEELYDHATDPHEWINLATDPAQAAQKQTLRRELCRRVGMTPPIRSASAPPAHLAASASTPAED